MAQLLLRRWPGLVPEKSPAGWPPTSFTLDAPFRSTSPVADGRIDPNEYGHGVDVTFDDDANPGRLPAWFDPHTKTSDDLSVRLHAAYTDRSLFLGFRVRDQFVRVSEIHSREFLRNDSVDVFLDGDRQDNDLTPLFFEPTNGGNREGFQIAADAAGNQNTTSAEFGDSSWKVGTSRTSDGYIIEFEIPLTLIDTRDGPEYVPATSGSEIRFNFGISDFDDSESDKSAYGTFWAEDPDLSPYEGRRGLLDGQVAAGPHDSLPSLTYFDRLDQARNRHDEAEWPTSSPIVATPLLHALPRRPRADPQIRYAQSRTNPPPLAVRLLKALPFPACVSFTETSDIRQEGIGPEPGIGILRDRLGLDEVPIRGAVPDHAQIPQQENQQFPASGFSLENRGVLISHFAEYSRIMLLRTPHLTTWTNGVASHGTCSR